MIKTETLAAQGNYVCKSNALVRNSDYTLTMQELKLVNFMISKIQPSDKKEHEYKFSVTEFRDAANLNKDAGIVSYLDRMTTKLGERLITIETDEGITLKSHWFSTCELNENDGTITFTFASKIVPYLMLLRNNYVQYHLEYILAMDSEHAIRLYEYLKSVQSMGAIHEISVDDLRFRMGCKNSYQKFADFRVCVLQKAVNEINKYCDIVVDFSTVKQGRNVVSIKFSIRKVKRISEVIERSERKRARLGQERIDTKANKGRKKAAEKPARAGTAKAKAGIMREANEIETELRTEAGKAGDSLQGRTFESSADLLKFASILFRAGEEESSADMVRAANMLLKLDGENNKRGTRKIIKRLGQGAG